jgi:hypothetical protein
MALLAALGRMIGRTPPPPAEVLEAYAHVVIPVLDRAEWLYQHWLEQSQLFSDSETLGNVAAVHRWETATMGRSLEGVTAPAVLASAHEDVVEALEMASRAAQMLSHGSRYHSANAVCEGQALLTAARERRIVAMRTMRRYLLHIPPAHDAELVPEHRVEPDEPADGLDGLDEAIAPPDAPVGLDEDIAPPSDAPAGDTPAAAAPGVPDQTPPAPVAAEPSEPAAQVGWGSLFGRPSDRTGE